MSIYLQILTDIICIYQQTLTDFTVHTTLGTEMSLFTKNKKVPGFQHLLSLWDSTLPCGS